MSTIRAFIIHPDDNQATDGTLPTNMQLEALQSTVGGWVEVATSSDGRVYFWFNEEGKIHDLPVNGLATAIWWAVCPEAVNADTLRGSVVITGGVDANGATLAIPDDMAEMLLNTYVGDDA